MDLEWFDIINKKPVSNFGNDIDVIVKIEGICSMTASEYEEYRVVKWRPKNKLFIEWNNGKSVIYNDDNSIKPRVTHWSYFNKV